MILSLPVDKRRFNVYNVYNVVCLLGKFFLSVAQTCSPNFPEVWNYFDDFFFKFTEVVRRFSIKKVFLISCEIHKKTHAMESLFNNVSGRKVFCCEFCKVFMNTYFVENLQTAASAILK